MNIPFNKIYLNGKEKEYINDALKRGHLSGDGFYTELVSSFLEKKLSLNKVFMTTSGTHALEMAVQLIDLKKNDEVIMPSFTFTSTANAVLQNGAKVVFAEIKADTLNLDPEMIEKKISEKSKAIIVVHYAGIGCDMDKIMKIADKYNLYVIEDAAHAVNAKYKNKYLGSIGHFGCFSFHSTKNYTSGEGGALIINEKDSSLIKKAEIIREKGTNRSDFLRGNIDKYTWVNKGSSYLP
ncbi:MAG: dTDP-4-amino-4,6-dideoxygalactose transaminase, partial [Bacillota bacterium]